MMNSVKCTSIDLIVNASPHPLSSGINTELSLLLLVSIGRTIHASFVSAIH